MSEIYKNFITTQANQLSPFLFGKPIIAPIVSKDSDTIYLKKISPNKPKEKKNNSHYKTTAAGILAVGFTIGGIFIFRKGSIRVYGKFVEAMGKLKDNIKHLESLKETKTISAIEDMYLSVQKGLMSVIKYGVNLFSNVDQIKNTYLDRGMSFSKITRSLKEKINPFLMKQAETRAQSKYSKVIRQKEKLNKLVDEAIGEMFTEGQLSKEHLRTLQMLKGLKVGINRKIDNFVGNFESRKNVMHTKFKDLPEEVREIVEDKLLNDPKGTLKEMGDDMCAWAIKKADLEDAKALLSNKQRQMTKLLEKLQEKLKQQLPKEKHEIIQNNINALLKEFNNATGFEGEELPKRLIDLYLGNWVFEILAPAIALGLLAKEVVTSNTKDEQLSKTVKLGLPIAGGITTWVYTSLIMCMNNNIALIPTIIAAGIFDRLGDYIDNKFISKGKDFKVYNAAEALNNPARSKLKVFSS